MGNLGGLLVLELTSNQLTGNIPSELGNLSNLRELKLGRNQLTGNIPSELGNLSNLEILYLDVNQLTGSIPSELGNLSNLRLLFLGANQLTGSIPHELGNLSSLEWLILDNNQLNGNIPSELGNLSNLIRLYLYNNQLTGSIPTELGNSSNLEILLLDGNQLTGNIPQELCNLSNLQVLDIHTNLLSGEIPSCLGTMSSLTVPLSIHTNKYTFNELEPFLGGATIDVNYSPQRKVDTERTITAEIGETVTIEPAIPENPSGHDSYQWYKDGNEIPGATSRVLTLTNITADDFGVYTYKITNSQVPDLTLESEPITLAQAAPSPTVTDDPSIPDPSTSVTDDPPVVPDDELTVPPTGEGVKGLIIVIGLSVLIIIFGYYIGNVSLYLLYVRRVDRS